MLPEIPGLTTGELTKLVIMAFDSPKRTNQIGEDFAVMFNPTGYSRHFEVTYCPPKPKGSSGSPSIFSYVKPQEFVMEFLFDGTGVAGPPADFGIALSAPGIGGLLPETTVKERIDAFLALTYQMEGTIHRSKYLKLKWGDFVSHCIMKSADIEYTLFKPDGEPLRAKVKANFKEDFDEKLRIKKDGLSSPDLTHLRQVEEEENLPLMSQEIYRDPSYYLQLARSNKLKHFRRLRTGQTLSFPPIRTTKGNS